MDLTIFTKADLCAKLLEQLGGSPLRFMEVCGTHTVALFQHGLRSLLPAGIEHLSGPGCPVCVTHDSEIACFLELAGRKNVIIATFGDLLRVPVQGRSLKHAAAEGARIEIVYSPLDALRLAAENPQCALVFLGVGFETTAPTVAATVLMARQQKLDNFMVLSCHKRVPPALRVLLSENNAIDAFLLPGHVATVLGMEPFAFVSEEFGKPAVIAGFEPVDILQALCILQEQHKKGRAQLVNAYPRAVADNGNPRAREIMEQVFEPCDALWRGLGAIPQSGLALRDAYAEFDAFKRLNLQLKDCPAPKGCHCGDVLKGHIKPNQCPLFKRACTPASPIGPCMVSTEGSCAAWYTYGI